MSAVDRPVRPGRRLGASLGVAALIAAPALVAGCTPPPPPPLNCGFVGFAPNSDWGAFDIRATRTTCATARGVASGSKFHAPRNYSGYGWTCIAGRPDTSGLWSVPYRCTGPYGGVVTFIYS